MAEGQLALLVETNHLGDSKHSWPPPCTDTILTETCHVTAEARRRGMMVNHKRLARIMRTDNLLTIQNRELRQVPGREHGLEVYLNLAGRMTVRGPNQLWIADITYVRLKTEFVYLAVVLDAVSRKVGWSLDRSLQARFPTSALERAIMSRQPPPGLVHHSDQGVQYRCAGYIQVLREHQMVASISRPGYPYDNASCESFMKTLKREEIYASSGNPDDSRTRNHARRFCNIKTK